MQREGGPLPPLPFVTLGESAAFLVDSPCPVLHADSSHVFQNRRDATIPSLSKFREPSRKGELLGTETEATNCLLND